MTLYQILYNRTKIIYNIDKEYCCSRLPGIEPVKKLLKLIIDRKDLIHYWFNGQINRRPK